MKKVNYLIAYMLIVSLLFSLFSTSVFASETPVLDDSNYNHINTDCNEDSVEKVVEAMGSSTITIKNNESSEILEKTNSIEKVSKELFGNVEIKLSDYLFNLDGSFDYIYVEFSNGGYAIFMKDSMELLEYSPQGRIDYSEEQGKKFYGGPNQYFSEVDGKFINIVSGETLNISNAQIQAYSENVRTMLKTNYSEKMRNSSIQFDLSSIGKEENNEQRSVNENVGNVPSVGDYPLINNLPISEGTYIANYMYFLTDPTHGTNTSGTCGAVAAQLLLSFHNYYSDRRIVDNIYLNGSSAAAERHLNPNFCEDPMSMTSQTLGTRGSAEDGSDITNSYFAKVVSEIPSSATVGEVKSGIKDLLNENGIDYSIDSQNSTTIFGYTTVVDSEKVISEIDAGRPMIVLMQPSLGGPDHYAVVYGYQDYTYTDTNNTYLGYITHYGHGSDRLNIWVNSAWCSGYVTLDIEHTHDYDTYVGAIDNTGRVEYKCGDCGHRTDCVIRIGSNNRYTERTINIPISGYKEYMVTFTSSGNRVIQTFGANTLSHDAFLEIYDANGTRLDYDDDSGYERNALISYNFSANIEYRIRVRFCNTSTQSGDIRLAIVASSCDTYESIYSLTDYTLGLTWSFTQNNVNLLTYQYSSDQDLTMRVTSEVDTYLYIIDPSSTDSIVQASGTSTKGKDSLYNDDYDGSDSQITKTFNSNIPYLVIVSAYDPSLNTSVGEFYLDFE